MRILLLKPSRFSFLLLIITLSSLALLSLSIIRGRASANSSHQHQQGVNGAERISLRALGERPSWLNLDDGRELPSDFNPRASSRSILRDSKARALSLASGDFDEDGTADLVSGYRVGGKGLLTIHRGNTDAIFANAPEAKQHKADGTFTDAAFLTPAAEFEIDSPPEMIFTGDFDADKHLDVLAGSVGGTTLSLSRGDGHGHLLTAEKIDLEGRLTAMTVGKITRNDGLADVAVATVTSSGPQLLIFSGPSGAFKARPSIQLLTAEATAMTIGRLNQSCESDLVIAAGHELLIMHRPCPPSSVERESGDGSQAEVIESRAFAYQIKQVAIGDFIPNERNNAEIALMREDGGIDLLKSSSSGSKQSSTSTGGKDSRRQPLANWEQESATGAISSATTMLATKVSSGPVDDLIVLVPQSRQVHIVSRAAEVVAKAEARDLTSGQNKIATFEADEQPAAVIAMRLSASALEGLVMLRAGNPAPVTALQAVGMTFTVTTANDCTNCGSLRDAITAANNNPGADTITFNIGTGQQTISPTSALPVITEAVVIDGTTQPGFAGAPLIELNGTNAGSANGLSITGGSSTVRGLVVSGFAVNGIKMAIGQGNVIEGNFIGTNAAGTAAMGNGAAGVRVEVGSDGNTIGGTTASARNIISGNGAQGILIFGFGSFVGNRVQGNYIGTDVNGTGNLGNGAEGVRLENTANNRIGGTVSGAGNTIAFNHQNGINFVVSSFNLAQGNVISGNSLNGIHMFNAKTNTVQGNFIGTNAAGTAAMGNGAAGVRFDFVLGGSNTIGGTTASARNIISGNGAQGISISASPMNTVQGNYIGTDVNGTGSLGNGAEGVLLEALSTTIGGIDSGAGNIIAFNRAAGVNVRVGTGNAILSNSIFSNTGLGIDLGGDGVTPNHNCDGVTGPNDLQNFPVVTSAFTSAGGTTIAGALNSTTGHTFRIEFFANLACDSSGFGQGQTLLGSTTVTEPNNDCNISFSFTTAQLLPAGQFVTATATDVTAATPNLNDTSEFSRCFAVCTITCPANISTGTGPGATQCCAVVPFSTMTSGPCGTVMCSPPSGICFPLGTTTVNCSEPGGANCSFTVTVVDNTPPVISCPSNIATVGAASCPIATISAPVNFTVTATDNCPGAVNIVCVNQNNQVVTSGQTFPSGTTTITCTATDAAGNTSMCSFTVSAFSFCLQDETNPGNFVLISASTGDYSFFCNGVQIASGRGTLKAKGCQGTIEHQKGDRRVLIGWDTTANGAKGAGTAIVQLPVNNTRCQITDKDMSNNTCSAPAAIAPPGSRKPNKGQTQN